MDGVRQEQVVVANLKCKRIGIAGFQKPLIPAGFPFAVTELGDADALLIVATEMRRFISVQAVPQGKQHFRRTGVFLLQVHLCQPPLEPFVADVVGLALADYRLDGFRKQTVRRQSIGQQWKVFIQNSVLQGNAGGGNQDGPDVCAAGGMEVVKCNSSCEKCVGLSDAGPGVAQGNAGTSIR